MVKVVLAAILLLAPHVGSKRADSYARMFVKEANRRKIDPLLVVSLAYHESRMFSRKQSPTNDYGLMQVHVSSTTHPSYRGREIELLDPKLNIYLGVKILAFWRDYYLKHCKDDTHIWWGHYKWGYKVRNDDYARRIRRIYRRLQGTKD